MSTSSGTSRKAADSSFQSLVKASDAVRYRRSNAVRGGKAFKDPRRRPGSAEISKEGVFNNADMSWIRQGGHAPVWLPMNKRPMKDSQIFYFGGHVAFAGRDGDVVLIRLPQITPVE